MAAYPYPLTGIISSTDLLQDARVFPQLPGIDFLVEKVPLFATGVKTSSSGREVRTAYYPYPLYRYKVQANFLRSRTDKLELQKLLGFFNSQQGRYGAFFYQEQENNAVVDESFGTGNGTSQTFQLMRDVGKGTPFSSKEPVYAVWKAPVIKVNGTIVFNYTVDVWGKITFTSAPASGAALTWTGNVLSVCRFNDDEMSLKQMMDRLWSQDGLEFRSIRP